MDSVFEDSLLSDLDMDVSGWVAGRFDRFLSVLGGGNLDV
jgi:hypothetical protein